IGLLVVAAGTLVFFYTNKPAKEIPAKDNKPTRSAGNNKSPVKPAEVNQGTVTSQARNFTHSVARNAGKSGPDITESCEIAAFLVSPYWQQLATKKTVEQEKFYQLAAQEAIELLTAGHGLTEHDSKFRTLLENVNNQPRLTADRKEYDQYWEQKLQEGRQDYRDKYTQAFDKEARRRLGVQEK
ncbi:MAG: hypothetical protein VB862_02440, partial [Pirellulaceae bacterium]